MGDFEFNAPQLKFDFNVGLDDSDGADTFFGKSYKYFVRNFTVFSFEESVGFL